MVDDQRVEPAATLRGALLELRRALARSAVLLLSPETAPDALAHVNGRPQTKVERQPERSVRTPGPSRIKVAIIADRKACGRGVLWPKVLDELDARRPNEWEIYRLADRIPTEFFLRGCKVLVVNWDAINGDPDFGADVSLAWFRQRRAEILGWVRDGGILIMEGQATDHVPDQHAYNALLGASELSVCGIEDFLDPRAQDRRNGPCCLITGYARRSPLFSHLNELEPRAAPTYEDMFPPPADAALTPDLAETHWERILYRGWFKWNPFRRRRLPWVPLVKAERKRRRNHPTLLAAAYGKGVIFASTMLLASTRQTALISAMLNANATEIPRPGGLVRFVKDHVLRALVPAVAGVLAAVVAALIADGDPIIRGATGWLMAVAVGIAVAALAWSYRSIKVFVRDLFGW